MKNIKTIIIAAIIMTLVVLSYLKLQHEDHSDPANPVKDEESIQSQRVSVTQEQVARLGFDKAGKSVFAHDTEGPAHGIFTQDGQFGFHQRFPDMRLCVLIYSAILLSRFWM